MCTTPLQAALHEIALLRECLTWTLDYIDAIPSDIVASFPTMPGFDRDYVNQVVAADPDTLTIPELPENLK